MPRLISVFSIPDLGFREEPWVYAAGFPVRLRLVLLGVAGLFAALQLQLPLGARIAGAAAGVVLGAVPLKPPPAKLFAKREPAVGEPVYWAPMGSILVYVNAEGPGELVVLVDGEEYDRLSGDGGLARVEGTGLAPGEHAVRLVLGERVLRELRVYSGEKRAQARLEAAEGETWLRRED